jgi:hypothetical protein
MIARGKREARRVFSGDNSAKGARYDSQGQARSASPLVNESNWRLSTESAKYHRDYYALSELHFFYTWILSFSPGFSLVYQQSKKPKTVLTVSAA